MGLLGGRKTAKRRERVEPRLYASRGREPVSERRSKPKRRRGALGWAWFYAWRAALLGCILLAGIFTYIYQTLDHNGLLKIPDREPGIMVLASDGTALAQQGAFYGDEVRLSDLPDYVPNAIIAIEDRRFYSHFGVDPIGLMRAMAANLRSGHLMQGGSTLTQQLAKNLFLTPDRTLGRKMQEAVLAVWLETHFTKEEILQLYLNRIYFGGGGNGIERAAQAYYHKSARDLTIGEAATIAGLLKAPTTYNPINHPEAAAERGRLVLNAMVDTGAITADEAQQAVSEPAKATAANFVPATQYVVDWVNEQLPLLVKDYGQSIVIETTIDPKLQAYAEKVLRQKLSEQGAKLNASQAALVVMDDTGAVKALVGGRSYKKSQFNRVTKAKRQPGSAFKPFVYLAALEQGMTPDSIEVDEPVKLGDWTPENYKQKYMGPVTLRTALARSLNAVAVKLAAKVGPKAVIDVAHRLGIVSDIADDSSIALGTSEVTPLELTAAYVPFANGGRPVLPYSITRISTRGGQVLYQRQGNGFDLAVPAQELGEMNDMMRAVVTSGTAKQAQFGGFDIAGKTGTSQDYRDAWFIGYTSHLVAGVWVGNDDNSPTQRVTGGSLPAQIWRDVMARAHEGLVPEPLPGLRLQPAPSQDQGPDVALQMPDNSPPVAPSQAAPRPAQNRSGGFLEDLTSLFSGTAGDDAPPRRKNSWAPREK